ncbi:hypothetical protein SLS60_006499 [Paraconiothyrium brasiliense]|uniref:Pectate lyase n=1 Tax=Paraconiothyrium brasiliense TaxID=300254 RepID=A0ABR3RAW6_9PLEO
MYFSFSTIVTVALIVSTAEAVPRNVHVFDRSELGAYRALSNRARAASGNVAHKSFPKLIVRADDDDEDISKTSKANTTTSATSDATATGDAPSATTTGGNASAPASSAASATGKASGSVSASVPAASGGASGSSTASAPASSSGSTSGNSTTGTMPASAGQSTLSEPMKVTGVFDGGMVTFDRGVECTGQTEGDDSDAVFDIQAGGTLKNVIIGANQKEGVHCQGSCTLENVWWEAVCEDAFTIKVQEADATTTITGGGASGAEDKVLQHNGGGTLKVSGFTVDNFGKLYRACGNCKESVDRHVELDNIKATGGTSTLVGINPNFGDTAKITNSCITGTKVICEEFEGTTPGNEPKSVSTGPSDTCVYTDADINAC